MRVNDHVVIRFKSGSTNPTQSPMTTAGDLKKAFHGKNSHYRQDTHSENINYFEEGCPCEVQVAIGKFKPAILRLRLDVELLEEMDNPQQ